MAQAKKLQNYFNDFLPQNYHEFRRSVPTLMSNQAVVAELLRICCEEDNVKAIQLAFERIIGKPEKVVVIKRTLVRTIFPDARTKMLQPGETEEVITSVRPITEDKVVIDETDSPSALLRRELDKMDTREGNYSFEVLDDMNNYSVVEVMVANLYAIAMKSSNLAAISMLFDYLDGSVADVIRVDGLDTILLENYADVAPHDATQGEDGVWYIEREAVS